MATNQQPRSTVNMNFLVPVDVHRSLKTMAAQKGTPLQDLIVEILRNAVAKKGGTA